MKKVKLCLEIDLGEDWDDDVSDSTKDWLEYFHPCDYDQGDFIINKVIIEDVKLD